MERINLRLPAPQVATLEKEAEKRGIKTATCARDLLVERLSQIAGAIPTPKQKKRSHPHAKTPAKGLNEGGT